jgi:hypothetical protein
MTRRQAREYKERWRKVNARQLRELRTLTPEQKLDQWARLWIWVKEFGWDKALAAEEQQVRDRWNRIRRAYGVID